MADAYILSVNAIDRTVEAAPPSASLLRVLREHVGLPGTQGACEEGECGSCSVLVDGVLVCACLVLARSAVGKQIVTIEGLTSSGIAADVQRAFVAAGAVQCGFCTPGFVVATYALLAGVADPDELDIREALSGNICRCTGYGRIVDAVCRVAIERSDRRNSEVNR